MLLQTDSAEASTKIGRQRDDGILMQPPGAG